MPSNEKEMEKKFDLHTEYAYQCVVHLIKALNAFCNKDFDTLKVNANKVIELEDSADKIRREVTKLIRELTIPYVGQDRFKLLDLIDDIADRAELLARYLLIYPLPVPNEIIESLKELGNKTLAVVSKMFKAEKALWTDIHKAIEIVEEVQTLREDTRSAQFDLIKIIFQGDIDTETKIMLKEISVFLGRIADKAEEIADYISFIGLKYKAM
ncbi:MAG: DUF47 family protein [Candidatus Odinarchaeota archaeon]|nr:DUF47 family protein [Candidatus Odinarchaeota archaeon]